MLWISTFILNSLSKYRGALWNGPDGKARMCYPVVGAFQVDYPEACLLTLVRVGQACPICWTSKEEFGLITTKEHWPWIIEDMKRKYIETLKVDKKLAKSLLKSYGLIDAEVQYRKFPYYTHTHIYIYI